MSPMPHSIFFAGGFAIHGTYETGALGRPASHGCVRLDPANAALLYKMVKAEGAVITISGSPPRGQLYAGAGGHHHRTYYAAAPAGYGGYPGLAYAPAHYYPDTVQGWQFNPFGR